MPQQPPAASSLVDSFAARHYPLLACVVLMLAACNHFLRLGSETVTEWDESLYATSAAEMLRGSDWIVTTRGGAPDYYNSKPPLNTWLIAASFKAFGINIWALRLPSAFAGFATVSLLMWWVRRAYSAALAIASGTVMATCFAALYVHSARTANADALFTLLMLSIVVVLWRSAQSPAAVMWLGPLLAACFLLKGAAVLLPGVIAVGAVWRWTPRQPFGWARSLAVAGFVLLTGWWVYLRWRFDGTAFFNAMVAQDLIGPTVKNLEGHAGPLWFYLTVLAKYQYDWIALAAIALCLIIPGRASIHVWWREMSSHWASVLVTFSGGVLLIVPSLMQTKATWYGHPLLPFFSIAIAAIVLGAARRGSVGSRPLLAGMVLSTLVIAESRIWWHSFNRRDLAHSDQGLLLQNAMMIRGHHVVRSRWTHADRFVVEHMIGAVAVTLEDEPEPGKPLYWLRSLVEAPPPGRPSPLAQNRRFALYRSGN